MPSLKIEDLNQDSVHVRTYRNRRIGDFLKELHLTEGRCTGVPKIHRAMAVNGSPPAIFQTDEESRYFLTILPLHPEASRHVKSSLNTQVTGPTHRYTGVFPIETLPEDLKTLINNLKKSSTTKDLHSTIQKLCAWQPLTAQQLADLLQRKDKKHFVRSHLTPMIRKGELHYLFPEDEDSPNQAYVYDKKKQG